MKKILKAINSLPEDARAFIAYLGMVVAAVILIIGLSSTIYHRFGAIEPGINGLYQAENSLLAQKNNLSPSDNVANIFRDLKKVIPAPAKNASPEIKSESPKKSISRLEKFLEKIKMDLADVSFGFKEIWEYTFESF